MKNPFRGKLGRPDLGPHPPQTVKPSTLPPSALRLAPQAPPVEPEPTPAALPVDHHMSADEQRIHDWVGTLVPQDFGLAAIPHGFLGKIQNAIATGEPHAPRPCEHCHKLIQPGDIHRWGPGRHIVHEGCRDELFNHGATLGQPNSRDDKLDHDVIRQNVDGARTEAEEVPEGYYEPKDYGTPGYYGEKLEEARKAKAYKDSFK